MIAEKEMITQKCDASFAIYMPARANVYQIHAACGLNLMLALAKVWSILGLL